MHDGTPSDPLALATHVGRLMYERDAASQSLGIKLLEIRPGYARMSMYVRPDMCNGHGICHGGLIFTLADSTFAYACNSFNVNTVALGCTIDFLASGKAGDVLTAVGEARQQGGRTGLYDVSVIDPEGATIALFRGKSYRIKGDVISGLGT